MYREIERKLSQFPSRLIEHATIAAILDNLGYKRINDKIQQLKSKNILTPLKAGYYIYNPLNSRNLILKEIIANILLGPSYISLDYALWYHRLIPENVYEVTSITTKRSKSFDTEYGLFSYKQIKNQLFNIGLIIERSKHANFIIASKEKALCDKVYFTRDLPLKSYRSMAKFLEEDLRIDFNELYGCDINLLSQYMEISKSQKIETLIKLIEKANK